MVNVIDKYYATSKRCAWNNLVKVAGRLRNNLNYFLFISYRKSCLIYFKDLLIRKPMLLQNVKILHSSKVIAIQGLQVGYDFL